MSDAPTISQEASQYQANLVAVTSQGEPRIAKVDRIHYSYELLT